MGNAQDRLTVANATQPCPRVAAYLKSRWTLILLVLVAFFTAALVTSLSIFYGYLSDSIAENLLSDVDQDVISWYQSTVVHRRISPCFDRFWFTLKTFAYRCFRRPPPIRRPPLPRAQRVEALTRFVLGFSDQQLITGLAIQIAALANRRQLTLFELQIVFCLAWFSAITHIATLTVLRQYFYDHGVVRNYRVVGIVAFLCLLLFVQIILLLSGNPKTENGVNFGRPIQCIIDGNSLRSDMNAVDMIVEAYLLVFLALLYLPSTFVLFKDPAKHTYDKFSMVFYRAIIVVKFREIRGLSKQRKDGVILDAQLQQAVMASRRISGIIGSKLGSHLFPRYTDSFLASLPFIMFGMSYGVSQTIMTTWIGTPKTSDDVRRMGFGQVVAIALLAIPVLNAAEIYNEVHAATTTGTLQHPELNSSSEQHEVLHSELIAAEYEDRKRQLEMPDDDCLAARLLLAISKELIVQPGGKEVSPIRRHLLAFSALTYVYKRREEIESRSKTWNRICRNSRVIIATIFALDIFVEIFGGIPMNAGSFPVSVVGIFLLLISAVIRWIGRMLQIKSFIEVISRQFLHRDDIDLFSDMTDGTLGGDSGRSTHRGSNSSSSLSRDASQTQRDEQYEEVELGRLTRQDTEADMAIVRRRDTGTTR